MPIIVLDMLKTFDRVSHSRLLAKIKTYGIRNPLLYWPLSYLFDRFQIIDISGCFSQSCVFTIMVVQGSVLCSFRIPLYNNDISKVIRRDSPCLFADNIRIDCSFKAGLFNSALALINEDLKYLDN